MPGIPIRIESGRRGASIVRASSDMAARIEDAALDGRGVRAGEGAGAGLSVQDSMPPKVPAEMLAGLVPVSPASDFPSPLGGGLGRGDISRASASHDSFTLADSLAMASPPVRPGLFAKEAAGRGALTPAEPPPKNPIMSPIMSAYEVPDDVAEWVPRIVRNLAMEVGYLADQRSSNPREESVKWGRDILASGVVRVIAMEERVEGAIVVLLQDVEGTLSTMVLTAGKGHVSADEGYTYLEQGLHVTKDRRLFRAKVKKLITDGAVSVYRAALSSGEVVQTIRATGEKPDVRSVRDTTMYVSTLDGTDRKRYFTFNGMAGERFEQQESVMPLSDLPDAVLNLAAKNIKANGGGGFGGYSPVLLSRTGRMVSNAIPVLCRAGARVIGVETAFGTDQSYFLLQDELGKVLLVYRSDFMTRAMDGRLFKGDGLYYSTFDGLGVVAAGDEEYRLIVGQQRRADGGDKETGFLLGKNGIRMFGHCYFAGSHIYLRSDERVFRDPVIVDDIDMITHAVKGRDQSRAPLQGNILLMWEGRELKHVGGYRDPEFTIQTDLHGIITTLWQEDVADTDHVAVVRPVYFTQSNRPSDSSGTIENVSIVEDKPGGMEKITPREAGELCEKCHPPVRYTELNQLRPVTIEWIGDPIPVDGYFKQTARIGGDLYVDIFAETGVFDGFEAGMEAYLRDVPRRAWEDVREIRFYENTADSYGLDHKDVVGHYDNDAHVIRVFGTMGQSIEQRFYTVFHEFGHALLNLLGREGRAMSPAASVLTAIAAGGSDVEAWYQQHTGSNYFASSWQERLCEAFRLYLKNEAVFRAIDGPMTRVIEGFLTFVRK